MRLEIDVVLCETTIISVADHVNALVVFPHRLATSDWREWLVALQFLFAELLKA
jgi:hypothetical protein